MSSQSLADTFAPMHASPLIADLCTFLLNKFITSKMFPRKIPGAEKYDE